MTVRHKILLLLISLALPVLGSSALAETTEFACQPDDGDRVFVAQVDEDAETLTFGEYGTFDLVNADQRDLYAKLDSPWRTYVLIINRSSGDYDLSVTGRFCIEDSLCFNGAASTEGTCSAPS